MWSRIAVPAIEPMLTDQPMEDLEAAEFWPLPWERRNSRAVCEGPAATLRRSPPPHSAL